MPVHAFGRMLELERVRGAARVAAGAVDLVVALLGVALMYSAWAGTIFLLGPQSFHFPDPGGLRLLLLVLGLLTAYLTVAWATTGRTFGNRLLGLRVVDDGGGTIGLARAFLRAAACVMFPIVLFWVVVSRENRSLPDVLLRTSVVYDWTSNGGRGAEPTATPRAIVLPQDD